MKTKEEIIKEYENWEYTELEDKVQDEEGQVCQEGIQLEYS